MAGKPTKPSKRRVVLTKEVVLALAEACSLGHSIVTACGKLGVSEGGYYKWRNEGLDIIASKRKKLNPRERLLVELVEEVKKADAAFVQRGLVQLQQIAMTGGAKTAWVWCWLLERRRPHEFGRRNPNEVDSAPNNDNVPSAAELAEEMFKRTVGDPPAAGSAENPCPQSPQAPNPS